jgi:DNA (cytosine-5)-methyltransferase 1
VAQRRRRVFVVGYLGDWRRAAAVLFERESLLGHPAPRREAGERVARPITPGSPNGSGYRNDADTADNLIPEVCPTLVANGNKTGGIRPPGTDGDTVTSLIVMSSGQANAEILEGGGAPTLTCLHEAPIIAHTLRANGHDASEDDTGRGTPLVTVLQDVADPVLANVGRTYTQEGTGNFRLTNVVMQPVPFDTTQITSAGNYSKPKAGDPCHPLAAGAHPPAIAFSAKDHGADAGDISPTLRSGGHDKSHANGGVMPAVAFEGPHDTANIRAASGGSSRSYVAATAVRRLTPMECERLQGFPDDYTLVPYRNKPASDGPRYKSLGNSFAVPVVRWIGERIAMVESLIERAAA